MALLHFSSRRSMATPRRCLFSRTLALTLLAVTSRQTCHHSRPRSPPLLLGMHGIEWSPLLVAAFVGHAKVFSTHLPLASPDWLCVSRDSFPFGVSCPCFPHLSLILSLSLKSSVLCVCLVAKAVEFLLASGADRSATSAREHLGVPAGSTPLAAALLQGHTHVAALLQ
jgi:hypothetical protein